MPLYEYQCKKCGHRFERIQSYSAEDVKECPICHGEVERLISAPAIRFKGSGFYETDYGAKSVSNSSSSSSSSTEKAAADGAKPTAETSGADKPSTGKPSTEASASPKVAAATKSSE